MGVLPEIAPITPPAAVPIAAPLNVRCSVSDIPAHPESAKLMINSIAIMWLFMIDSFL
jgi:hypothetical protein